jgi:hypothetical protein
MDMCNFIIETPEDKVKRLKKQKLDNILEVEKNKKEESESTVARDFAKAVLY